MADKMVFDLKLADLFKERASGLSTPNFIILDTEAASAYIIKNQLYQSDYFGLILVLEGYSSYQIGDVDYQMGAGDILFCTPNQTFKVLHFSEDYKSKQIFFSVNMLNDAGFNYRSSDIVSSMSTTPTYIIKGLPEIYELILFHINRLQLLTDRKLTYHFFAEMSWHHFSLIMYEIQEYSVKYQDARLSSPREEEIASNFFILLRENFREQHSVQFYSDALYISRKYLTKVIIKTLSKSPKEAINDMLLVEAKLLLRNSNQNINQISNILNFSNQQIFNKFFKKMTAQTPRDYKNSDLF